MVIVVWMVKSYSYTISIHKYFINIKKKGGVNQWIKETLTSTS